MPKSSVISPEEQENIVKVGFALKKIDPKMGVREIAKQVQRSKTTVHRVMSDKKFSKYRDDFKKSIDSIRFEAIAKGDKQVLEAVENRKLTPFQLIGLSKTYYEQSFGLNNPQIAVTNNTAVQVVEGVVNNPRKSP